MAKKIVVYTYAVGDLLHRGHRQALRQAKALGDYLIVGVLTDEATATYKRKPIIPLDERMEGIEELPYVDEVVIQYSLDPVEAIRNLNVDIDIITHAHQEGNKFPGNNVESFAEKAGIKLVRINYYPHQSTTKIIEKILREAINDH